MPEPDISIQGFRGLQTHSPNAFGDISDLITAENVQFNQDGIIRARRGFLFFTNMPSGDTAMIDGGRLHEPSVANNSSRVFLGSVDYYKWLGDRTQPELALAGSGTLAPTNFKNRGAQYTRFLYFVDGRRWDGSTLSDVVAMPSFADGAICSHAERVWLADTFSTTNRLLFSAVGDGTTWPAANFIDVGAGAGGDIVDLRSFQNRLWIFKTRSLWVLETPGVPTSWVLRKFSDDGCIGQSSCEYDGYMYWIGKDGVFRYNGSTVERVSDPIQDVFEQEISTYQRCHSAGFRDHFAFFLKVAGTTRIFCFQTKLGLWSEWKFAFSDSNTFVESLWAEPFDDSGSPGFDPGLYLGIHDGGSHGMIIGNDFTAGTDKDYMDQLGTRIGTDVITDHPYSVTIQTKFSDLGTPSMKRVTYWLIEYEGADLTFEQVSESGIVLSKAIDNPGLSADAKITYSAKIKGIGYFRRVSLRFILSNLNNTLDSVGARVYNVYGYVKSKGKQIRGKEEVMN